MSLGENYVGIVIFFNLVMGKSLLFNEYFASGDYTKILAVIKLWSELLTIILCNQTIEGFPFFDRKQFDREIPYFGN